MYPREMKRYLHKDLHKNIHRSHIHNNPKLETTQMNIDTKRDEQIVVYSFDGILSNQTEQSDNTCNSMNQSYGLYTE